MFMKRQLNQGKILEMDENNEDVFVQGEAISKWLFYTAQN